MSEGARANLRLVVAALVVVGASWLSAIAASFIGWSFEPKGWHRVTDGWPALVMSAVVAGVGIVVARVVAGRDPRSWWLLVALVPPIHAALADGVGVW